MNRLYDRGLVSSVGGNVSKILREEGVVFITPSGLDKMNVRPEDIVKVKMDGSVIGPGIPSSETIVHLSIYKMRRDVSAIVHAHPPVAVGVTSAGFVPKGTTPEFVVMIDKLGVVNFIEPGIKTAKAISKELKDHDIVVLKNHGVFSVGESMFQAFSRVEVLEESCKMLLAGKVFGGMNEFNERQKQQIVKNYVKK
ncbi:MAG: class II aldolase/adducin family protein [Nitrososphaerota archaeon]